MAKSKTLKLNGFTKWAKIFEHNTDEYNGIRRWTMQFYPDAESEKKLRSSGTRLKFKEDDDGVFVNLKRPTGPKPWLEKDGTQGEWEPPKVVGPDGKAWDPDDLLGNGTEVTVTISIYQTRMGPGTRLDKVKITNWKEYDPDLDDDDDYEEDEEEEIVIVKKPARKRSNNDIPF